MARRIRITFDKVRVYKSEDYSGDFLGIGGEPGDSAEWTLWFQVKVGGQQRDVVDWVLDGVKDGSVHDVDKEIDTVLDGPLQIHVDGQERDDVFKWDELPRIDREYAPEPGWDEPAGATYKRRTKSNDYEYQVYFTIRYLDPPPVAQIAPGHGTLRAARYAGLWDGGQERLEWFLDLTVDQLNVRASWLWGKGGRLRQLQPVMRGSEVRYNSLWDYSGIRQLWNVDCDEAHFRKTTDENWSWARPRSVIPFVRNGQVRYAVLWNAGQHSQLWHPNVDEAGFLSLTGDTWAWARPHQVYAFVVGGQVRYSCLWNAGQHGQRWHHNCGADQARAIGGEVWSWARAHQIQPFYVGKELRYSILWNAGQQRQLWNVDCDEAQVRRNMADTSGWGRAAQVYEAS